MPGKSWRRLAGCIAISCAAGVAASDYRAGTAEAGGVKAVVLVDREGNPAVVADAAFTITMPVADFIAAELLKKYPLNRPAILLHSAAAGKATPADAITAVGAALANLEPVRVVFDGSTFSIASEEGQCRAAFFPVRFAGCLDGTAVRPPIRGVFQVIEPEHGLQRRNGAPPPAYSVQAIAFGKQAAILALGGDVPASGLVPRGVLVIPNSNGASNLAPGANISAAIRQALRRIGR